MDIRERLAQARGFEWDAGNPEKNRLAHRVSAAECEQLFFNQPLIVTGDAAHSRLEERFYALGQTDGGRGLFVAFTLRGDLLRVISARDMSRKERKVYESHG
jgi:uncharacterized DUF497 family protein